MMRVIGHCSPSANSPALALRNCRPAALSPTASSEVVVQEAVQEGRMRRVDAHLEGLQPVAVPQALEGEAVRGRRGRSNRTRGRAAACCPRRRTSRTGCRCAFQSPGSCAAARVRTACCRRARPASPGSGRRRRTSSRGKGSAGRRLRAGRTTGRRRGAGSRGPAGPRRLSVAEQHQVLAQDADGLHRALRHARVQRRVEFVDQRGGLPVLAQHAPQGVPGVMRVNNSFCSAFMAAL
jgi:hypothetical protein